MTKHYAVIGDPIAHSLSPLMQNAAFRAAGIDADYSAIHVKPDDLAKFVKKAKKELDGFNITVPHKNAIIPFLDEISENAKLSGSVNTVTVTDGKLKGDSTDGYGLETALRESFNIGVEGNSFCFLGCGGAARATAFYFASKKAKSILFINRTLSKADELAAEIGKAFKNVKLGACSPLDDALVKEFLDESNVLIQCTSLGLKPDDPPPIDLDVLPDRICLYETIYKKTALLKYAEKTGSPNADGRSMLLHQGAKSFSIWTGVKAPVEVMREALYGAIESRDN